MTRTEFSRTAVKFRSTLLAVVVMTMVMAALHVWATTAEAAQGTLAWSATTTNTDGTPITGLAGYNVYFGSVSGSYQQKVDVGNVTSYMLSNLADGSTYYFATSAYNTAGQESALSKELSKTFPAKQTTYTISTTAGAGGAIIASSNSNVSTATNGTSTMTSVTVTSGANQSFTITPNAGYKVASVTVDGAVVGAVTTYTFNNVTANHTLSATFSTSSYTITGSAGTGGSISPSGTVAVTSGGSQTFAVSPSSGYSIASVVVDGVSVGAVTSYTFSSVSANHTIQANFAAVVGSGSSSSSTSTATFATNCGGAQYVAKSGITFTADGKYSGGNSWSTTAAISGTSDAPLYQSERYGNFTYSVPVANGSYSVTLKFAENYFTAAGQRVFNVTVNGQTVISKLDIYAKAGAKTAYDVVVPVTVTSGAINIGFVGVVNNAKVNAIQISPSNSVASGVVFAANSGGSQFAGTSGITYQADSSYSGGATWSTTATISGTTDGVLYQTERYGNFAYNIPVTNGNYSITLKFAENYFTAAGQRVFNVTVNGQAAVSKLDIYAKAGAKTAYDVVIPVSVTNGAINIGFTGVVNNAKVNAVVVKPA
jgi:hypothetical protein